MDSNVWNERYATTDYLWTVSVNRFVEEHLTGLEPGDAIDLGAGEGRNSVWLAGRGWSVTAIDFSRTGLEKAERLADDHDVAIETVEADVMSYEAAEPVDLVVIAYLQLPRQQQRTVLHHAKAWLKPGGTLFVIAHDETNVDDGYGGPPSVEVCYSVAETVDALVGLDITVAEVARRSVETDEGTQIALDTLVITKRSTD